ncbi:MAG TPA: glycosyltransferase family 39 protein, partial [bacterium]|nr:glycosyltransferase family 39 protein [bacterium]
GRSITALLGAGTVAFTYILGRDVAGKWAGILAALFLAVNPLHLRESQTIAVDVPMTFFSTWALVEAIRIQRTRSSAAFIRGGIAVGLAASSKYTGAILLVPLLAAHFFAPQRSRRSLVMLLGTAVAAFVFTSPFVLIDFSTFWRDLSIENRHMAVGHFGDDPSGTLHDYAGVIGMNALSWPLAGASLISLVDFAAIKRQRWAWILGSFLAVYALLVANWSMRADRYLLPIVPSALVLAGAIFAAAFQARAARWVSRQARSALLWIGIAIIVGSLIRIDLHEWKKRSRDTRAEAKQWIETHVPSGALLLTDPYAPDLFDALELIFLDPDVRARSAARLENRSIYAMLQLPMFQVEPERSAPYYDLSLYPDVDLIITSGPIRSRYLEDRARFPKQSAFYDSLDATYQKIQEFAPEESGGPQLTLYINPQEPNVFASRTKLAGPLPLKRGPTPVTEEAFFYYQWGIAYEFFGFIEPALQAFAIAEAALAQRPQLHRNIALAIARCIFAAGDPKTAAASLRQASAQMPNAQDRQALLEFERFLDQQKEAPARQKVLSTSP